MTFEWALQELRKGRAVKREEWKAPLNRLQQNIWIDWVNDTPILRFLFSGILRAEDLFAEDWVEHIKGEINAPSK